jgi:hypothetical protein
LFGVVGLKFIVTVSTFGSSAKKNWVTFCQYIFIIHKFVMSIVISGPLFVERDSERERDR